MAEEKKGFFKRLVAGLAKTRDNVVSGMDAIFSGFSKIDEDFYEELEETLIMGDLGVATTEKILDRLREQVKEQKIHEPMACRDLLIDTIREQMKTSEEDYEFERRKSVVLVVGVNGAREDHDRRQTGRKTETGRQKSPDSPQIPSVRCRHTAGCMGRPCRCRDDRRPGRR